MNLRTSVVALSLAALIGLSADAVQAQSITTDGSLGAERTLDGPNYVIAHDLGQQHGANLFHSFNTFSVLTDESATFTGPQTIQNIISRVTGGLVSSIDGLLASDIPGANLYLLNPAGVMFGPNASLDVGGSVHFSTANFARFSDGMKFFANLADQSELTSAPIVTFGFLGLPAAPITVAQSALHVPTGQTLSLVAGDIELRGSNNSSAPPTIQAHSGIVRMASVASAGEVRLVQEGTVPAFSTDAFATLGSVRLTDGAAITVQAPPLFATPAGEIIIRAGRLTVENASSLTASTGGNISALPVAVDVKVRGPVLLDTNSTIGVTNQGANSFGHAGAIQIAAGTVDIQNNSAINTFYFGHGNAADVQIQAGAIRLATGGKISGENLGSNNLGHAGTIDLRATDLISIGPRSTITTTNFQGRGNGSAIELTAPSIAIEGGASALDRAGISGITGGNGTASSVTLSGGTIELKGANALVDTRARNISISGGAPPTLGGGPIVVRGEGGGGTAADRVLVSGPGSGFLTETEGLGPGGNMSFHASAMTLTNQSRVSANTKGAGAAGTITLDVGTLEVNGGARIEGNTVSGGTGGTLVVQGLGGLGSSAAFVTLNGRDAADNVSGLFSTTTATGAGGNVRVAANQIAMSGGTISVSSTSSGNAGAVTVNAGTASISEGGRIESSTTGAGNGGTIAVTAQGDVTISGLSADGQTRSGIFAKTLSADSGGGSGGGGGGSGGGSGGGGAKPGNAGDITIVSNNLLLDGGAQIDSSTTSGGRGGSVSVTATEGITLDGVSTRITSDASRGNGAGGSIVMEARNATIREGASVTAATGGTGAAGSVEITLQDTLRMESAGTITTSTRGSGNGGPITIQANQVMLDGPGTAITAETLRPFADLAVTLNVDHLNTGDLVAQLDSPAGTRVALFSRVGGTGDNFIGTTLDDQASMPITSASAPFTDVFTPREPLAQLIDQPAGGTWTLNVRDAAGGPSGTLQSWSLRLGTQTFQSSDVPHDILNNGSVQSNLTVSGALNALVQGTGEVSGAGGNVTIDAGSVTVQNGAALSATSRGSGTGGTLNVVASSAVLVTGTGSGLFSDAEASGRGGDITMEGSSVAVNSGAKVSASSSGTGDAGSITITTPGMFASTGGAVTTTAVSGRGGDIRITAGEVNLNGAVISASSLGPGNAGSIVINSGVQFFSSNSMVTTRADQASGGDITVNAQDMIRLINSQINTSVAGGTATTGGNISIDPQFVILQNSKIVAQAFQGTGGNITIVANQFLSDPASIVDASSQLGVSGTVDIRSPITNLDGDVTALPGNVLEVANLLQSSCLARMKGGQISSLIQRGRDEVPAEPGSPAIAPLFASTMNLGVESLFERAPLASVESGLDEVGAGIHVIGGEFRIGGLSRLLAETVGQGACSKPGLFGLSGLSGSSS